MFRALTLTTALIAFVSLTACAQDPFVAGKALGDKHTQLIQKDALTFEVLTAQVEEARADYADDSDKCSKFDDGYREGVKPVRAKLAAMMMENAGEVAGKAIGDVMEGFGEGLGRAVDGFMRGLGADTAKTTGSEPAKEGAPDTKESMRQLGRGFGKMMKTMAEGAEAVAEGIEEELEKSE